MLRIKREQNFSFNFSSVINDYFLRFQNVRLLETHPSRARAYREKAERKQDVGLERIATETRKESGKSERVRGRGGGQERGFEEVERVSRETKTNEGQLA